MTSVSLCSNVSRSLAIAAGVLMVASGASNLHAQAPVPSPSAVAVSASATVTVQNDRLQAWLRVEAENANPAAAASQVNAAIAKALASAKAYRAVKVLTAGYSTQQVSDKRENTLHANPNRPRRKYCRVDPVANCADNPQDMLLTAASDRARTMGEVDWSTRHSKCGDTKARA